jgi:succinate dehydrogenase/fumarate reductase cytochrome b subunit
MTGFYLWIFQSVTALYLFVILYFHIFVAPFTDYLILDVLFVCAAVFHGFNGLWIIIDESFRGKGWKLAEAFGVLLTDFRHNRHVGHFLFILHRLTGLFILLYLTQHLFTNSFVSAYLFLDDIFIIELLRNDFLDYLTFLSIGFHAINGMRLIFIELTGLTWLQRRLAYLSLALGLLFTVYVTVVR